MADRDLRSRIERLLEQADVKIDGSRPWDIQVHNDQLYQRIVSHGTLGFGEAYMDGWWDAEAVDELIYRLLNAHLDQQFKTLTMLLAALKARLFNRQSVKRAYQVGEQHYNAGNDLYRRMLDERMIYSCGYWKEASELNQAQQNKLDLTCRKLLLEPGHKVLDIGCGWGGTARYMAENYGVEVVGITISTAQAELARTNCQGLPVEIRVQDYRDLTGQFDRIVSIGMFEHVGVKNYSTYFAKVAELLSEEGLFLLHTIGGNSPANRTDPWIDKYIFPNGMIPSARQVSRHFEDFFILEDLHNFGRDYDRTLIAWHDNFSRAWPELKERYSERFRRMWEYYLLACAASFRARTNQVWQFVLSKGQLPGRYDCPR